MQILSGQHALITKHLGAYNREKSSIICEAGNNVNGTWRGDFLAHIYRRGYFRFNDNGTLGFSYKKVK